MKALLSIIISWALVVSGYAQTRNVLVGTNNAVVQPTNFWSADASNARSGLGLGTSATNPASAFQPSSATISNLASSNGGALTNLQATNIVGLIPTSNIPPIVLTNIATITIAQGGTGATNAANARQNLGSTTVGDAVFIATNAAAARTAIGSTTVGSSLFTLANPSAITFLRLNADNTATALSASDFRTALSLGTAATNPSSAFQPAASTLTNLASGNGGALTNLQASNVTGTIAISNGGSGATTAGGARTNLGLGALSDVVFNNVVASGGVYGETNDVVLDTQNYALYASGSLSVGWDDIGWSFNVPFNFVGTNATVNIATSRTNLGLGWSALTNSNAGTGLVSVNTNGEVVSPTNFWQVAPIVTRFVETQPTTNQTTNITAARNLHIHSLAISTVGVTNTVALPTTGSFNGDIALVVHQGPTSSVTAVRTAGAGTNLVTLNKLNESVEFVYYNNVWQFNHNRAQVEPIYFSGTNATANAAASRENLGLGISNIVYFNTLGLGRTEDGYIIEGTSGSTTNQNNGFRFSQSGIPFFTFSNRPPFGGRLVIHGTNGGIDGGLNVFKTNVGPFEGVINAINSNNTAISNETLFRVGVAEATNKSAQFGFRSTNTNGDGVAVFSVFGYNALMMIGPSDPAAGTNPIEATVYSVNPTNKVMTLITTNTGAMQMHRPIEWDNTTNSAVTRTNLGLGLPALTNTNNAKFQESIFTTNAAPTNSANVNTVNFNTAVSWMAVNIVTNGVTNTFHVPLFK